MTVALIALAGTIVGVVATMLGAAVSDRRQARNEERRWRRDQLNNAYEQALRYLLRAADRRSQVDPGLGAGVLNTEHHRDWFDDLAEARTWLMVLVSCCARDQVSVLRAIVSQLDLDVVSMTSGHGSLPGACDKKGCCDMRSTARTLRDAAEAVAACARTKLGPKTAPHPYRELTAGLPAEMVATAA